MSNHTALPLLPRPLAALLLASFFAAGCAGGRSGWEVRGESPPRPGGAAPNLGSAPLARSVAPATSARSREASRPAQRGMTIPGFHVADEPSLRAVIDDLRTLTGLPLVVDHRAEEAVEDAGVVFDLRFDNPIRVRSLLDLLVELSEGTIAWTIRHGAVLITTPERARGGYVLRFYDVRDLVAGVASFPRPRIGSLLFDGDDEDREIVRASLLEEDTLVDLITSTIAPGTWDDEGVSIEVQDGILIVRHTAAVHAGLAAWPG